AAGSSCLRRQASGGAGAGLRDPSGSCLRRNDGWGYSTHSDDRAHAAVDFVLVFVLVLVCELASSLSPGIWFMASRSFCFISTGPSCCRAERRSTGRLAASSTLCMSCCSSAEIFAPASVT